MIEVRPAHFTDEAPVKWAGGTYARCRTATPTRRRKSAEASRAICSILARREDSGVCSAGYLSGLRHPRPGKIGADRISGKGVMFRIDRLHALVEKQHAMLEALTRRTV
jgi:hypothetical protein